MPGTAALALLTWWPAHETSARPLWTAPALWARSRELNYYRYHPAHWERDLALAAMVRASGVREVALVATHDSAYPLMRRLRREVPGLRFHGAPAEGTAATAPEAILALELGAPLALFYDGPGGVRYRLTGTGSGDGLYFSETRVRTLGWAHRLPAFAGWTSHRNLLLRVGEPDNPEAPLDSRVMAAEEATVFFPGWEGRGRFAATVRKTTDAAEWLDLSLNSVPVGRVTLRPSAGLHHLEVPLPVRPGANMLALRRPSAASAELVFFRLQIDDAAHGETPP
jgi:hypothetical protein